MAQSSQRLMVLCKGKGLEPHIELTKNSLEFEPILPHSIGDEQEIKIINPCPFPVEIYNLEFDKIYLEEEKVSKLFFAFNETFSKVAKSVLENTKGSKKFQMH